MGGEGSEVDESESMVCHIVIPAGTAGLLIGRQGFNISRLKVREHNYNFKKYRHCVTTLSLKNVMIDNNGSGGYRDCEQEGQSFPYRESGEYQG